jgi:hypothetical protein
MNEVICESLRAVGSHERQEAGSDQLPPSDAAPPILRRPLPSYKEMLTEVDRLEAKCQELKRAAGGIPLHLPSPISGLPR